MTATERLRQLLDKRGVEWWNDTDPEPQHVTVVHFEERIVIFHENVNGTMGYHVYNTHDLTHEQAVEATLGRGTCKIEQHGSLAAQPSMVCWSCSECSFGWHHSTYDKQFSYCPNCGRRVEP